MLCLMHDTFSHQLIGEEMVFKSLGKIELLIIITQ